MHIRDLVKQKWADEGLYASKKAKVQAFLKYIEDKPLECWDEYVKEFRDHYYNLFDELVPPLMKTRDKLLRLIIIRNVDLSKPKEVKLIKEFVKKADPIEDEPELLNIAKIGHKGLSAELCKCKGLTDEVRKILQPPPPTSKAAKNIVIPESKTKQVKSKQSKRSK